MWKLISDGEIVFWLTQESWVYCDHEHGFSRVSKQLPYQVANTFHSPGISTNCSEGRETRESEENMRDKKLEKVD